MQSLLKAASASFFARSTSISDKLSGRQAANYLEEAGIIVNKNTIPFDKRSANCTSGIRLGTPMITSRGMKEPEMVMIADFISETIKQRQRVGSRKRVREKVQELCRAFPVYEDN